MNDKNFWKDLFGDKDLMTKQELQEVFEKADHSSNQEHEKSAITFHEIYREVLKRKED